MPYKNQMVYSRDYLKLKHKFPQIRGTEFINKMT